jgi:hypothetical protein
MKRSLITTIILFAATVLAAQDSQRLLKDDFNTFIRYVEETHPDPIPPSEDEWSLNVAP